MVCMVTYQAPKESFSLPSCIPKEESRGFHLHFVTAVIYFALGTACLKQFSTFSQIPYMHSQYTLFIWYFNIVINIRDDVNQIYKMTLMVCIDTIREPLLKKNWHFLDQIRFSEGNGTLCSYSHPDIHLVRWDCVLSVWRQKGTLLLGNLSLPLSGQHLTKQRC